VKSVEDAPIRAGHDGDPTSRESRRARWLLACGAVGGLALAGTGVLDTSSHQTATDPAVAAEVNGVAIPMQKYERALAALEQDTRDPLGDDDAKHVLDRLIDEELLVQRAVALGLDQSDPVVRNTLVSAMIEMIVSGVGQREPEPAEVEAFYEANREFFARSDRYWVRQMRFPFGGTSANAVTSAHARATADEAVARLRAGEKVAAVALALGGASVLPLPDGYLPAAKLREYLGPTPALRATAMQSGEVSDPIEAGSAWHVLQMVERVENPPLPLSAVESSVRAELRRRAGDESLRTYLAELREGASIRVP